jgi:hypothetical protein
LWTVNAKCEAVIAKPLMISSVGICASFMTALPHSYCIVWGYPSSSEMSPKHSKSNDGMNDVPSCRFTNCTIEDINILKGRLLWTNRIESKRIGHFESISSHSDQSALMSRHNDRVTGKTDEPKTVGRQCMYVPRPCQSCALCNKSVSSYHEKIREPLL